VIDAQNAAGSSVGIEPDHAAIRREPLDPVVQPARRIGKRAVHIREAAGMGAADVRQYPVQRDDPAWMHKAPLRRCWRYGQQER
jgi:hypothetical protein